MKNIELKVDRHPGGNRTLKRREKGTAMWTDCHEISELMVNADEAQFYRATASYIAEMAATGHFFSYADCSE